MRNSTYRNPQLDTNGELTHLLRQAEAVATPAAARS